MENHFTVHLPEKKGFGVYKIGIFNSGYTSPYYFTSLTIVLQRAVVRLFSCLHAFYNE